MFLIRIDKDLRLQRIVMRPIEIIETTEDGEIIDVELIDKTSILCDVCSAQVALNEEDLESGLPIGYVLCDEGYLYEVVCEECREKYYGRLKIYDDLDEALGAER